MVIQDIMTIQEAFNEMPTAVVNEIKRRIDCTNIKHVDRVKFLEGTSGEITVYYIYGISNIIIVNCYDGGLFDINDILMSDVIHVVKNALHRDTLMKFLE